jgi:uncharacterized membrane protein YczE
MSGGAMRDKRADFHVVTWPTFGQLARRLPRFLPGLVLIAFGTELTVLAGLGLEPWDVLHQGLAQHLGISFGEVVFFLGLLILLLWIPLKQKAGLGTIINVAVVGVMIDGFAKVVPALHGLPARWAGLLVGLAVQAVGAGLYIGAGLGPGPRDGLMTAVARRGHSIALVRTIIEVIVFFMGWALGGTVGIGTLILAFGTGPATAPFVHLLHLPAPGPKPIIGKLGE